MNRTLEVVMRTEVGSALNHLIEHPPTSVIDYSNPEMVQRFTDVASAYLHQGFDVKSVEGKFDQEITRQVNTVKYLEDSTAGLLMRLATEGMNKAQRETLAGKKLRGIASHTPKADGTQKKTGRRRKDDIREKVVELHSQVKSWVKVQRIMNRETGQTLTVDAYRKLASR